MNILNVGGVRAALVGLALFGAAVWLPLAASAADEQKFDVLQIGTQQYQNVTVTTKTKDYVFILHSGGMANLKVKDLPAEVRYQLGYVDPAPPKTAKMAANDWAKQSWGKIQNPQVKAFEQELQQAWTTRQFRGMSLPQLTLQALWPFAFGLLAVYLFFCYCCQLIRRKTGKDPSALVWFPVVQMIPMLDAAGMSGWWFLGMFVPVVNLIGSILWCFNIAKARGKNAAIAIMLLLPILHLFAFFYLAFADRVGPRKQKQRVEIMTLEAA